MTWYSFRSSWPDGRSAPPYTTNLADNEKARRYAHLLIQELKRGSDYSDVGLRMVVRDDNGDTIHIIPF